jgi:transposase
MPEGMRWVGLDVHACESACALFDGTTGEVLSRRLSGRPHELLEWLEGVQRPFRAVYEAGPTGYGLARRAAERGFDVRVCAPGHIARRPGDRVKTDKRDGLRLARLLAAGDLTLVTVPPLEHERVRDLVRCREDVRGDLMRVRHRIGKFLLRRELYYPGSGRGRGGRNWTQHHRDWLSSLRFDDRASELCFADYLHAHDALLARRDGLDRALAEIAPDCPWAVTVGRLRCLRGVDTLTALGLCAEVSDFGRFAGPEALACYLGLVPSESSSGERRRQGSITKAGSGHARRLLVEAAHHYSRPPRVSQLLSRRQEGQPGLGDRDRLALSAPALRPLAAIAGPARQARRHRDRRDRPRARRLLLGARRHRVNPAQPTTGCWGGAGRDDSRTKRPAMALWATTQRVAAPESRQRAVRRTDGLGAKNPRISA